MKVLLLDEPFGALDPIVRASLREGLRSIVKRLGVTTIIVTHDQVRGCGAGPGRGGAESSAEAGSECVARGVAGVTLDVASGRKENRIWHRARQQGRALGEGERRQEGAEGADESC